MGFFQKIFQSGNPKASVPDYDINEVLGTIDEEFPPKPMVRFNVKHSERLSVFDSKLGGVPYMPADQEYPMGRSGIFKGRPLYLLAQLNFERLPHIENFPEKGILQLFFSDDKECSAYGSDSDYPLDQNGFRVLYHENIITDESCLMPKEKMPVFSVGEYISPFKGEFLLEPKQPESCPVSYGDHHIKNAVLEQWNRITGKEFRSFDEADSLEFDGFVDKIFKLRICEHTCIGGYPFFTQDDPRKYKKEIADHNVLLFQFAEGSMELNDSDDLGDMEFANFFIREDDLKRLDFSKTAYNCKLF